MTITNDISNVIYLNVYINVDEIYSYSLKSNVSDDPHLLIVLETSADDCISPR